GGELVSLNPATGKPIATVRMASEEDYGRVAAETHETFLRWRLLPAPKRGEIVRQIGEVLRANKEPLAALVTLEMGKIIAEGRGEVQEMIDIADFAVGLSRQLYGLSMHSERAEHRMYEQWHPLGIVAVITSFNFPMAVWAWNAAIAAVCGDVVIWKPSPKTPLCAVAVQRIVDRVMARHELPGVFNLLVGGNAAGEQLVADRRVALVSFTGSVAAGRQVAARCATRLGRSLLELGGNNAIVVMDDADLALALRAITFSAAGTAGQRCTTARRLFVQRGIAPALIEGLRRAYGSIAIGEPQADGVLMGPLIDAEAVAQFEHAVGAAQAQGGRLLFGGARLERPGHFVQPTLVASEHPLAIASEETFAPILYIVEFDTLAEAIAMNNAVPQGLSSAIITDSLRSAEAFLSASGSDCGIANVNIGTSGAEIGGAFGGEKDSGGGRESGSDAWKNYMRRQTCTINYGRDLPLAQGVRFDVS
ncbi:MAG: aldehyde dehydrogenase family protein, partial [Nevskia sp.]|nr:aldehyde dehydrogenase family protein [Nevskia sp.]